MAVTSSAAWRRIGSAESRHASTAPGGTVPAARPDRLGGRSRSRLPSESRQGWTVPGGTSVAARRSSRGELSVHLLGRVEVVASGAPVRLGGRQAQALFALLVLDPRPRSRDAIAVDLW